MSFQRDVKDKKVLVFGLGLQGGGLGDALWLSKHGAKVRVTDPKNLASLPIEIEVVEGSHRDIDIDWADMIIKNPAVPPNQPQLLYARQKNKPVLTSIAVLVKEIRQKTIAITGTRGKSTVTALVFELLQSAYPGRVVQGGNIPGTSGLALLDQVIDIDYAVLELSSFQLEGFHELNLSPHIAIVTNIYPDHLNRYPDMSSYIADKSSITKYQKEGDYALVNKGNEGAKKLGKLTPANLLFYSEDDLPPDLEVKLIGEHNRENLAAVFALAKHLGISSDLVRNIARTFTGLPYRLETVARLQDVAFVNDTTSTTPIATIKAINALEGSFIIIVGGESKNLPIDDMIELLANSPKVRKIVILGSDNNTEFLSAINRACSKKILGYANSMPQAVKLAFTNARAQEQILLSPGFASFDLFKNEFDRGDQFNESIKKLNT